MCINGVFSVYRHVCKLIKSFREDTRCYLCVNLYTHLSLPIVILKSFVGRSVGSGEYKGSGKKGMVCIIGLQDQCRVIKRTTYAWLCDLPSAIKCDVIDMEPNLKIHHMLSSSFFLHIHTPPPPPLHSTPYSSHSFPLSPAPTLPTPSLHLLPHSLPLPALYT